MEEIREQIQAGDNQPPKMMFLPSKELIHTMIKANIEFGHKDSL